jgi:hypothetical protein
MDKETEQRLIEMMERLLARQCVEMNALHERFLATLNELKSYEKGTSTGQTETTSCPEEMKDAIILKATLEATEAAVERQQLLKEGINDENVGSSEDRSGYRHLVVRCRLGAPRQCWVPAEGVCHTQAGDTSRRPCTAKRKHCKCPGRNSVGRVHPKSRTFGKKQRLRSEYNKRINCRDSRQQLRLRMKRTSDRCYRKPMKLEMANLIFGSTTGVQGINDWTFWKVRPPPKCKKNVLTA